MSLNDVDAVLLTHPLPQQGFGKAQGFAWLNDVNVVLPFSGPCARFWQELETFNLHLESC